MGTSAIMSIIKIKKRKRRKKKLKFKECHCDVHLIITQAHRKLMSNRGKNGRKLYFQTLPNISQRNGPVRP